MAANAEVAVFADTNLGTHIVMGVPPDITAGDFKRKLEKAHLNCFPSSGEIKANGLMVKRMSSFYHLPEWMPIKYAFQGLRGTWFLQVEGTLLTDSSRADLAEHVAPEVENHAFISSNVTKSPVTTNGRMNGLRNGNENIEIFNGIKPLQQEFLKVFSYSGKTRKRKKKVNNLERTLAWPPTNENLSINKETRVTSSKKNFCHFLSDIEFESATNCHRSSMGQSPGERFSGVIPDANINKRYPSSFCEGNRCGSPSVSLAASTIPSRLPQQPKARRSLCRSAIEIDKLPPFNLITPPRHNKPRGSGIGKRLLTASNNVRRSQNKYRSAVSICRIKNIRYDRSNAASVARYIAFEISSSDG